MRKNSTLLVLYSTIFFIAYNYIVKYRDIIIFITVCMCVYYSVLMVLDRKKSIAIPKTTNEIKEIILLSEEDTEIGRWSLYGKVSMVIGRDVGENSVTIDLNNVTYASTIEVHHAVLNYCGDSWYVEDVSEKNGIKIEKSDKVKYKIAYGKPCKIEKGDIIHITLTKLLVN